MPDQPARFKTGQDLTREISLITVVGVALNVVLAALKGCGAVLAGSRALMADAIHSLSDLGTDLAVLIGVRYWTAPADDEHPYGHKKIETMITLAIGLSLALLGLALGWEAAANLSRDINEDEAQRLVRVTAATWLALGAAISSIISKEILFRWTAAKGRLLSSSALIANAWHHRSDALSSIPPALAIGLTAWGAQSGLNLWYLDPLGTLVVCLMLLAAAWEVVKPTLSALVDASADGQMREAIRQAALSTPRVVATHKIRTRHLSPETLAVDLHIWVDGAMTVTESHRLAAAVKYKILNLQVERPGPQPVDVVIHVEPAEQG
ncbi:MAG: cation diffusion facilitator family transporter [Candidatus Adiutrix sp.]|jgi:cation diffusion facilitator family transporter|nr:cation diffusion facilitator family transporter [Candidatus Adiutrix sp.]